MKKVTWCFEITHRLPSCPSDPSLLESNQVNIATENSVHWISIAAAAQSLAVSRNTITRLIRIGTIGSRRLPELRRTQVLMEDVERIAKEGTRLRIQ